MPELLTAAEVAEIMRVKPGTVTGWARRGKIHPIRTPNGHRRFFREEVRMLLAGRHLTDETARVLREQWIGRVSGS